MRSVRCLLALVLALTACGCARMFSEPEIAAIPADGSAAPPPDLDSTIYGGPLRTGLSIPPAIMIAGVAAAPVPVVAPANPVVGVDVEEPYTLDSGDKLRVVVFGQDGLTNAYTVDAAGNITMPLIGSVTARGLTTSGLSRSIGDKLRRGFIREPHVAIQVEAYRPFFILGEVTAPGQYPYVPNMTVETAVAIAGGYTPRAFRKTVKVSRTMQGQIVRNVVPTLYPVRPGDTITISERWF